MGRETHAPRDTPQIVKDGFSVHVVRIFTRIFTTLRSGTTDSGASSVEHAECGEDALRSPLPAFIHAHIRWYAIVNSRNLTPFCSDVGVCKRIFTAQNFFSQYQRSCSQTKNVFRRPYPLTRVSKLQEKWWIADNEAGLLGVTGPPNTLSNPSANHLASCEANAFNNVPTSWSY
ncbi:hypothetical protein AZE42_09891, partial [Rhizopogon vesiculosus]